jgi:hypothetical protein
MLTCPVPVNSAAKRHRKAKFALKARCEKYRWAPTEIPKPKKMFVVTPVKIKTLSYCLRFHMLPAFCILKFEWELISTGVWEGGVILVKEWSKSVLSVNIASLIRWCSVSVEKLAFIQLARNY